MKLKELKNFQVPGFLAGGMACGLKKNGIKDLALIVSEVPATAAGMFTQNQMVSPTVPISRKALKVSKSMRAIIANSGNANCFTGKFGLMYAERTTELIGKLLNIPKTNVIVASTGIIGKPLPYKKIQRSANALVKGLSTSG